MQRYSVCTTRAHSTTTVKKPAVGGVQLAAFWYTLELPDDYHLAVSPGVMQNGLFRIRVYEDKQHKQLVAQVFGSVILKEDGAVNISPKNPHNVAGALRGDTGDVGVVSGGTVFSGSF